MNIKLLQGDITKLKVDAIVNAANTSLLGGGGEDGAIHRAAGPTLLEACREIRNRQGGCPVGEAVITHAGDLKAKYVIHTVGPRWNDGGNGEPELLANCYKNSLKLAEEYKLDTIAFPNISTGIYGYPKDQAAKIAISTVSLFEGQVISNVVFVCFDIDNYDIYQRILKK